MHNRQVYLAACLGAAFLPDPAQKKAPLLAAGLLIKVGLKRFRFKIEAKQPNDP
jgi:hypothetical protein